MAQHNPRVYIKYGNGRKGGGLGRVQHSRATDATEKKNAPSYRVGRLAELLDDVQLQKFTDGRTRKQQQIAKGGLVWWSRGERVELGDVRSEVAVDVRPSFGLSRGYRNVTQALKEQKILQSCASPQ